MKALKLLILLTIGTSLVGCSTSSKKDAYHGKSAPEIYSLAKKNIDKKRYGVAIKDLEALEARFPYGEYSDKAQLGLAYAQYKKKEHASAMAEVDRFMRLNPKHKRADYAQYLKGLILYDQNFSTVYKYLSIERSKRDPSLARQSFDEFKTLLTRHPKSQYCDDAKKRMLTLKEQLADHELYIAVYYFKKGAFLSAANRANNILEKFNETTAIPKALVIMVESYQNLGMTKLAKESQILLDNKYPGYKHKI